MPILLNGKLLAEEIYRDLAAEVKKIKLEINRVPQLAIVLAGNDPASESYIRNKIKACKNIGIKNKLLKFPISNESFPDIEDLYKDIDYSIYENYSLPIERKIEEEIFKLNEDKEVDGIIVQLPLPKHVNTDRIINSINPKKDVDGIHPFNLGKLCVGLGGHKPATPMGIISLLKHYKIPTTGKHCVIVGRSRIVGQPLSIMLSKNRYPGNCTVTLCHSQTSNLTDITKTADILISAIGKPKYITAEMVKENAVVIDVGISRVEDKSYKRGYRIEGDVDFQNVSFKASHITPVPKGVGPMTIARLMKNVIKATSYDFEGINKKNIIDD